MKLNLQIKQMRQKIEAATGLSVRVQAKMKAYALGDLEDTGRERKITIKIQGLGDGYAATLAKVKVLMIAKGDGDLYEYMDAMSDYQGKIAEALLKRGEPQPTSSGYLWLITDFAVHSCYQRKGIGEAIMDALQALILNFTGLEAHHIFFRAMDIAADYPKAASVTPEEHEMEIVSFCCKTACARLDDLETFALEH